MQKFTSFEEEENMPIIVWICILVFGVLFYLLEKPKAELPAILAGIVGMLLGLCIGVFTSWACWHLPIPYSYQRYEYDVIPITTLVDSSEMKGTFYLASGNLDSVQHYKYRILRKDGGKQLGAMPALGTVVYEEDRKDAYIAKVKERREYSSALHIWLIYRKDVEWFVEDAIHVPRGKILYETRLNPR
jgi:hypothetical protein